MLSWQGLRALGGSNLTTVAFPNSGKIFAIVLAFLILGAAQPCFAQTNYYVDPDFTGGARNGNASNPWHSLFDTVTNTPWTVINTALASGPVNVYFSARKAASDTNQTSTIEIAVERTDTSTNVLTLDGNSKYNTNISFPSWTSYSGNSKFRVNISGASSAISSENFSSPYPQRNYVTVHGFVFTTQGQIAVMEGMSNLVFEYNELYTIPTATIGPGLAIGQSTNTNGTGAANWGRHVIIRNNTIHDTFGEGIYVNGTTGNPPGTGTPTQTGDDILITNNTLYDCGKNGTADGDCIDIKDGNTNLRIVNNTIYYTSGTGAPNEQCQGMTIESATLIESNFYWSQSSDCKHAIYIVGAWNNATGRSGLTIRNNILIGSDNVAGISLAYVAVRWQSINVYNNTIYHHNDGIDVSDASANTVDVKNNAVIDSAELDFAFGLDGGTATLTHDYNNYWKSTGDILLFAGGGVFYNGSDFTTYEPHSIKSDPKFVSTASPFVDVNFKLRASSPLIDKGAALTGFTSDYLGVLRPQGLAWDIGAAEYSSDTTAPTPGNSGTITTSNITTSSITLNWTLATDSDNAQNTLNYKVCRSPFNNIGTVAQCEVATIIQPFTNNINTFTASGLSQGTTYYFNVVVDDPSTNKAIYTTVSAKTTGPDTIAPTPGNGGIITTSNVSPISMTLSWAKATDDVTTQSALQYEVLLSINDNGVPDNTQVVEVFTADIATFNVTGLASGTAYFLNVIVKDAAGNKAAYAMKSQTTSGLGILPLTLPVAAVGILYSQGITAPGATGQLTFSICAGALPSGLTLDALTGALSGTPVSMGTANFTVQVVDSLSNTGQRSYSLISVKDDSNNINLVLNDVSYDPAPMPGFVGIFTITVSIRNMGPALNNPVFFRVMQLDKVGPDLNPAQPDKLLSADNGIGVAGDIQSLPLGIFPTAASTDVIFYIGLGSRQQLTFIADLFGLLDGSPITADSAIINVKDRAVGPIGARLLKRFTFQVPESVGLVMSGESASNAIARDSNVGVITGPGSRSRSAVAIDPILPRRMAVAADDTRGNVVVSTTEDGGSTWHATTMGRSLGGVDFFNAQHPSLAFDSLGRLSVVYVLSNMNDAANAIVIAESTDGVNFNPPFGISVHSAEENVIDSRPVIAIGSGGRYVAWENFGSRINVVRSAPGGIFGPPVTVVSDAQVSAPAIAIGRSAVYIGWDEWGFNSRPPYNTGGRLMMASSPHGEQLTFSAPQEIVTTDIGFSSPRISKLPGPRGVVTNLNLAVDPTNEKLLYAAFVDRLDGLSIRFARSFEDGRGWILTTLKNCAGGGYQFSPAMNVGSDSNVYISFYDTVTKDAGTAHVFLATSSKGYSFVSREASKACLGKPAGAEFVFNYRTPNANWLKARNMTSFEYQQITTAPIDQSAKNLGSGPATNLAVRTAIAVSAENILTAWTDTRQGKEDIYVSILSVFP